MQTYSQTFTGSSTWKLNIPGSYFTILATTLGVNVRFYRAGKLLDLGTISNLLAGLEVQPNSRRSWLEAIRAIIRGQDLAFESFTFDTIEIDALGADTITIGIGNGDSRYNRSQGNVAITSSVAPIGSAFTPAAATVTTASAVLLAANASRKYLLIQNQDATGDIYIQPQAAAATANSACIKIPAGNYWEPLVAPVGEIRAIGSIASNANVHVSEA